MSETHSPVGVITIQRLLPFASWARMGTIGHYQPSRIRRWSPHCREKEWKQVLEPASTSDSGETAGQLWARHDSMQAEAASLLGQMLFAFSHIDVNLGLCLAWMDDGKGLEALSKSIEGQNFHAKLQTLSKQVAEKFPAGSKRRTAYERWIERMHTAREQRNQMVHGRWGIEARRHKVVNVVGLPSGTQQSIEYTLAELTAFNDELGALARELSRLREHWPI